MRLAHTLLFLGLAVGLAACNRDGGENTEPVGPTLDADVDADADTVAGDADRDGSTDAAGTMLAASATAMLQPAPGGSASGTLHFAIDDGGVRMTGGLTGLAPDSTHAMHIHAVGDCSAPDFTSAGDHFNPDSQPHGDRAGSGPHHAGDMPNQAADEAGNVEVDQRLEGLAIDSGDGVDIVGKAVIVHADPDDYATQPSGAAGGRIACGVIELENPAPEYMGPADAGPAQPTPDAQARPDVPPPDDKVIGRLEPVSPTDSTDADETATDPDADTDY